MPLTSMILNLLEAAGAASLPLGAMLATRPRQLQAISAGVANMDLVAHLRPGRPGARFALVGHSSGGGFAVRISATPAGRGFERHVLVAPYQSA